MFNSQKGKDVVFCQIKNTSTIGLACFNIKQKRSNQINVTLNQVLILSQEHWSIIGDEFVDHHWESIFKNMIQSKTRSTWLTLCQRRTVIKQISHINFQQLLVLNLSGNLIQNIEALSFLRCKKLQKLYLNQNHIVRGNSICKFQCPFMDQLYFYNNQISSIKFIQRINLKSQKQQIFVTEYQQQQSVFGQDLSFIVKSPYKNLSVLQCKLNFRIYQVKIISMIYNSKKASIICY